MKPLFFSAIFVLGFITSSFAQVSLGAHVAPAFPLGTFGNTAQTGFGFDVEARYSSSSVPTMVSASIGLHSFALMSGGMNSGLNYNITPITFSLLYLLSEEAIQPYLGLGVGINRIAYEAGGFNVSDSHFGVAPTFGIQYASSEQIRFDANIKYQLIFANENGSNQRSIDYNVMYVPFNLGVFYSFGQ